MAGDFVGVVGEFVGGLGWGGGDIARSGTIAIIARCDVVDAGFDTWYTGFVFGEKVKKN